MSKEEITIGEPSAESVVEVAPETNATGGEVPQVEVIETEVETPETESQEITIDQHGRPINLQYGPQVTDYGLPESIEGTPVEVAVKAATEVPVSEEKQIDTPSEEMAGDEEQEITIGEGETAKLSLLVENHNKIRQRFGEVGQREDAAARKEQETLQREQNIQAQLNIINGYGESVKEAISAGNTDAVMDAVAEMAQVDAFDLWDSLQTGLLEEAMRRSEMTDSELQMLRTQKQTASEQKKFSKEKTTWEQQQEEQVFQQQFQQKLGAFQSNMDEFRANAHELDQLSTAGQLKPEFANKIKNSSRIQKVEEVLKYGQGKKLGNYLDKLIESVNPKLKGDAILREELLNQAFTSRSYEITEEDLTDIIKGYAPEEATVSEAKPAASSNGTPPKQSPKEQKTQTEEMGLSEIVPVKAVDLLNEIF